MLGDAHTSTAMMHGWLIRVYNLLPQRIVDKGSVKDFQRGLQRIVLTELESGDSLWNKCLNIAAGSLFSTVQLS
jgi:hypothetical protein